MSTSLIVSLAFFVGLILSYKLLKKVIKSALSKKRNKSKLLDEETDKFRRDMCDYYRNFFKECEDLDTKVKAILKEACNKADSIIDYNKQELNKTLGDNINSNMKQVSDRVAKAMEGLKSNTASVAADTVKKMMHEYKDDKRSSEVISSFSRDLNKKLH